MEEKQTDQEVILVKEKGKEKLQVLSGTDEKGKLKTVPPTIENQPDFLKVDKHGSILENFFSNFKRQYENPTHFMFFKVPMQAVGNMAIVMANMLKDMDKANLKELEQYILHPENYNQKKENLIDENKVNWDKLTKLGLSKEKLEKHKALDNLLNWGKTPLLPILAKFDELTLRTDARLSLKKSPDGTFSVSIHAIRKEPELDRPFYRVNFSEEDKKNLQTTGNAGRLINIQPQEGEIVPAFVSIDKLTNEVVAARADKISIPDQIKGIILDPTQKQSLAEGKAIFVEGMTDKNGKPFDAMLQVNADKRGLEFQFNNTPKQNQNQSESFKIPTKLKGVDLTAEQVSLLGNQGTIYVAGMTDAKGEKFNSYIRINTEKGKLDFLRWNSDRAKSTAAEIIPDNASKTQVAVNSEGKTNEATKKITDPLKAGQTEPTEKQINKPKGIRM